MGQREKSGGRSGANAAALSFRILLTQLPCLNLSVAFLPWGENSKHLFIAHVVLNAPLPQAHYIPATKILASRTCHTTLIPASGPLHILCPLPAKLFSRSLQDAYLIFQVSK